MSKISSLKLKSNLVISIIKILLFAEKKLTNLLFI